MNNPVQTRLVNRLVRGVFLERQKKSHWFCKSIGKGKGHPVTCHAGRAGIKV